MARKGGYAYGMPSKEYWKVRAKEQLSESFDTAEGVEAYLLGVYEKNLRKLLKEYNALMKPFVDAEGNIDTAALQKAKAYDMKFIRKRQRLEEEIDMFASTVAEMTDEKVTNLLGKVYKSNINKIQETMSVEFESMALLNAIAVKAAVTTPFTADGREFSDRIWDNTKGFQQNLRRTLSNAIANGDSIQQTTRKFKKIYGNTVYNTQRLIRTETMAIHTKASLAAYEASGIDKIEVLAEADACEDCSSFDGLKFSLSAAEVGVNIPPYHPNCKCCVAPVVD